MIGFRVGQVQTTVSWRHHAVIPTVMAALLALPSILTAQTAVPQGTIIPVSLDGSVNADKVHTGQSIRATVMQNVPGTAIHRRAHILGHVIEARVAANGEQMLQINWDRIALKGGIVPVRTNLRALASFIEVEQAQIPDFLSSRGMTPEQWPTEQIGGDQVYRGGGPLSEGDKTVGTVTAWGVLGVPRTQAGMPCRGTVDGNLRPQALWLFSVDACGVYGYPGIEISHYGRDDPKGVITLSSCNGKLDLRSGTAMLLRVW